MSSGFSFKKEAPARIPKFDYKDLTKSRPERWRAFSKSLEYYLGTKSSRYVSYLVCNDLDETKENCNLPTELFDDVMDLSSSKKILAAQDAWATAQWYLQQCLGESFGHTDEATMEKRGSHPSKTPGRRFRVLLLTLATLLRCSYCSA